MSPRRRRARLFAVLVGVGLLSGLGACARPEDRYRVLSFFFDGVPPPDAEANAARKAAEAAAQKAAAEAKVPRQVITVFAHTPFAKNECSGCHKSDIAAGLTAPADKLCAGCHPTRTLGAGEPHAPVARGECLACHDAHQSAFPGVLAVAPEGLCDRCHGPDKYPARAAHAAERGSDCLRCHAPHAGGKALLRPLAGSAEATP